MENRCKGMTMKLTSIWKSFSEIPIPRKLGKILAWCVMGFGLFCLVLGMIVKDDMPALAQSAPEGATVAQVAESVDAPTLAQRAPDGATAANPVDADPGATPQAAVTDKRANNSTQAIVDFKRENDETSILSRIMSVFGIFAFIGIAWLMSNNRKREFFGNSSPWGRGFSSFLRCLFCAHRLGRRFSRFSTMP